MRLFCFGTLMDPDVRRLVIGRPLPDHETHAAELEGYRRVRVADETYPAAVPHPGSRVRGLVAGPITPVERDRVRFFEGFEFALEEHPVATANGIVRALVCIAADGLAVHTDPWELEDWQRAHKDDYLGAVETYMAEFDRLDVVRAHAVWVGSRGPAG